MNDFLHDFSLPAVLHANEGNQEGIYRLFSCLPNAQVEDSAEMLRICTGVPHFSVNGVLRTRLTGRDLDARIDETLDYFRTRDLPMMWTVGPSAQPVDLADRLLTRGLLVLDTLPGMAADLDALPLPGSLPSEVTIQEVTDAGMLEQWSHAVSLGFGMPLHVVDVFASLSRVLGYGEKAPVRNFVAYLDREPVGTATLYLASGVAGIYSVSVVPTARQQGIGAAITSAPLIEAHRLGYRIGVLLASAMGGPVYRRLGFREHGEFVLYGSGVRSGQEFSASSQDH